MAIEDINLGTSANDGTGDPLRVAGQKINNNNADFQQQINGRVQSVTGTSVDNTDPFNPVILLPKYVNSKAGITRPNQTTQGLINNQANTYEEYLRLEYTPTITDNFRLSTSFSWSSNNGSFNALFRVSISDGTSTQFFILEIEPKDVAGTGVVLDVLENGIIVGSANTGTDNRTFESSFSDYTLNANTTYTVILEWGAQEANSEVAIYGGFISLEQKTLNP